MKLSEAIRLAGIMFLKRGKGFISLGDPSEPCALGGAALVTGFQALPDERDSALAAQQHLGRVFPGGKRHAPGFSQDPSFTTFDLIWKLNDRGGYRCEQIADVLVALDLDCEAVFPEEAVGAAMELVEAI